MYNNTQRIGHREKRRREGHERIILIRMQSIFVLVDKQESMLTFEWLEKTSREEERNCLRL